LSVTTSYDKGAQHTAPVQIGGAAALEDTMLCCALVVTRFTNNHQIRMVTNGQEDLRVAAAEPFNCTNTASSLCGLPVTTVSHSILFVTQKGLTRQRSSCHGLCRTPRRRQEFLDHNNVSGLRMVTPELTFLGFASQSGHPARYYQCPANRSTGYEPERRGTTYCQQQAVFAAPRLISA
jgi:hypothetical protein